MKFENKLNPKKKRNKKTILHKTIVSFELNLSSDLRKRLVER